MSAQLQPLSVYLVNAFTTTTPHSGNQAGVVIFPSNDPRATDDDYKFKVAKDINYSETAFLVPISPGRWNLRWFTPEVEVALCGHATLASARVLFSLDPELQDIIFENRFAGELRAKRIEDDKNATKIKISLPTFKDEVLDALIRDAPINTQDLKGRAATVLGVQETDVLAVAGYPFGPQARGVIVQLKDDVDLGSLTPDAKAFNPFSQAMTIVTQLQPASSSVDRVKIRSRVFVAPFGIEEDPVTGSAHAYLTAYYLLTPAKESIAAGLILGDVENVTLDAEQLSARGGKLECRLAPGGMVDIVGSAAETARGTLTVW